MSLKYNSSEEVPNETLSERLTMNDDLKPCPFCGSKDIESGEALIEKEDKLYSQAGCNNCGALGPVKQAHPELANRDDASNNAWNIRA